MGSVSRKTMVPSAFITTHFAHEGHSEEKNKAGVISSDSEKSFIAIINIFLSVDTVQKVLKKHLPEKACRKDAACG
jgi:hypothetical protein